MASENKSSVDMKNGDKLAALGNQQKAAMKASFAPDTSEKKDQVINARKKTNVDAKKAKAKKRAKIAKASRKKNKK